MKATQVLLLAALVASPLAAYAETPDAIRFFDEPSTRTRAEVRAEAKYAIPGNLTEALGAFDTMKVVHSAKTRDEVRRELALMPPELLKDGGGAN
jgi:hypothetical protein